MQTTTKQIHIKATCENENRRFCIAEAKFDSLKKLITNLFPQANGIDFSVKYKDDENDLVTISSDDELMFAVNLFPTDILRIVVEFPKKADCAAPCKWQNKCDRRPDEKRCDWLTTKREGVQAKLKALEGADFQAKPGLFYKQEHLKKNCRTLTTRLLGSKKMLVKINKADVLVISPVLKTGKILAIGWLSKGKKFKPA